METNGTVKIRREIFKKDQRVSFIKKKKTSTIIWSVFSFYRNIDIIEEIRKIKEREYHE